MKNLDHLTRAKYLPVLHTCLRVKVFRSAPRGSIIRAPRHRTHVLDNQEKTPTTFGAPMSGSGGKRSDKAHRTSAVHQIGMDLLGHIPMSGPANRWSVVATDYMMHYSETPAIPRGSPDGHKILHSPSSSATSSYLSPKHAARNSFHCRARKWRPTIQ